MMGGLRAPRRTVSGSYSICACPSILIGSYSTIHSLTLKPTLLTIARHAYQCGGPAVDEVIGFLSSKVLEALDLPVVDDP